MECTSVSSLTSSSSQSLGQSQLTPLDVGRRVCYTFKGGEERRGVLRYLGHPDFALGEWAGILLDRQEGKNDGSVRGVQYFSCIDGYGVFVKSERVTIDLRPAPRSQPSSRSGSRPSSRHVSRHGSREGSPVTQRRPLSSSRGSRTELDGLASSRSASHLPRIPPGEVVPGSNLDHLMKALQPKPHTITTSPPKKKGPMKAFAMRTTRDGAQSAMDKKMGAADQTVKRCKSSMLLSSPKTDRDRPKVRRANSVDMTSAVSSPRPKSPKSPKRERKPTNEGEGTCKGKSAASPKKPKINAPLGKHPKTSTPKDAALLSSLAPTTSTTLQSEQGASPFPSSGSACAFQSSQNDSPSPGSSPSSHLQCSAAMLSTSVAPDSYSITPSRVEIDASVGNPGNQAFVHTPNFPKLVSPFNEGACTSLSQDHLDQLVALPYQSTSCGTEYHALSQALLNNVNNNNSQDGCRKSKPLTQALEMDSLPKQLKESVGCSHYDPPSCPLPQLVESGGRVKFTNRRSGASMLHPLAAATTTPQGTPPQTSLSQSSSGLSLTRSTVGEDTLHTTSVSPPPEDTSSDDSGRPQSHDTSCSPSSLVDSQSPLLGNSSCTSPTVDQSTLVITDSQLEELAALPREDLVKKFQKVCKSFRKRINQLKMQVKVPSPGSSEELTPERTRAELSGLREDMKEAHHEHLREMRDSYDEEIQSLQERHRAELKEAVLKLQNDQSMEIEMLKRAYTVTLQEIEEKHAQELVDVKRKHQRGKETIEEELKAVKERCCALEAHVQLHMLSLYGDDDDNDESSIV